MERCQQFDNFVFDSLFGIQNTVSLIERWTTMKYYLQTKILIILASCFVTNQIFLEYQRTPQNVAILTSMLVQVVLLCVIMFRTCDAAKRNTDSGRKNPYRAVWSGVMGRPTLILIAGMLLTLNLVTQLGLLPWTLFFMSYVLMLYVVACDEAPPVPNQEFSWT